MFPASKKGLNLLENSKQYGGRKNSPSSYWLFVRCSILCCMNFIDPILNYNQLRKQGENAQGLRKKEIKWHWRWLLIERKQKMLNIIPSFIND